MPGRRFARPRIHAALGGFHLFEADAATLDWTAEKLRSMGLENFLGAHCTGIESVFGLRQRLSLARASCSVGAVGSRFSLKSGLSPARSLGERVRAYPCVFFWPLWTSRRPSSCRAEATPRHVDVEEELAFRLAWLGLGCQHVETMSVAFAQGLLFHLAAHCPEHAYSSSMKRTSIGFSKLVPCPGAKTVA